MTVKSSGVSTVVYPKSPPGQICPGTFCLLYTSYPIEGDIENWTRQSVAIDYKSDGNPEKMNIIFSASDYFNRAELGTGNALYVDDVQLVYNSRLKSLVVDRCV